MNIRLLTAITSIALLVAISARLAAGPIEIPANLSGVGAQVTSNSTRVAALEAFATSNATRAVNASNVAAAAQAQAGSNTVRILAIEGDFAIALAGSNMYVATSLTTTSILQIYKGLITNIIPAP
ncbi:MAG: hypothetical protein HY343_08675 [Lentisphaerae bacterium]|nr:hypothetical protein [Lentisphaerota bacterium]